MNENKNVFKKFNKPICGKMILDGGKHGFSHILPVAALANEGYITNVPNIIDAETLIEVMRKIFLNVKFLKEEHILLYSEPYTAKKIILNQEVLSRSRSIYGLLPAILSHGHTVELHGYPKGCCMGDRPDAWYFDILKNFGAEINESICGTINLKWINRNPANINFKYPTMTGTVIAIAAALVTKGKSTLINASVEPSCTEEIKCALSMGGSINGSLPKITIHGKPSYLKVSWNVLHDRVHAVTFLTAALLTKGELTVQSERPLNIPKFIEFLHEAGVYVEDNETSVFVKFPSAVGYLKPVKINAGSEPLYSSDWIATTALLLATRSKGISEITDDVFPKRLQCFEILKEIGLTNVSVNEITLNGRTALNARIEGNPNLVLDGGPVEGCSDLRGMTALAMAALVSRKDVILNNDFHLRRGYEDYQQSINNIEKIGVEL